MNILLGRPGSGKTKELLKMSMDNNIPVLCESEARKARLLVKAEGYGYSIPIPVVYDSCDNVDEVYIDDIERLCQTMFNCKINTISVNITSKTDVNRMEDL